MIFYLSVPKCVCCKERLDKDDRALCKKCRIEYKNLLERNCSICSKRLNECSCSNKHLDSHFVHKLIKVFRYRTGEINPANALLYSLKKDNRHDVLDALADELYSSITLSVKEPENYLFTSVPRRRAAIIEYGIDHAELLARKVAKKCNAAYKKTLISLSKTEQKKSKNREERIKGLNFKVRNINLEKQNVILIDDIVTTGASMATAATLLKGCGAKNIIGASLAIAYKDTYTPFEIGDRFAPQK